MASVSDLRAFLRLTRPKFLFGGFAGFALGAAVARFDGAPLTWLAYLHGQVMVTAFHLMVHYSNDYFDRAGDAFGRRTPWSGGSGALVDGSVHSRVALVAATLSAAAGLTAAAAFSLEHRFGVAVLGVAIGVLAWAYSAPPLRLAARGWGELDGALVVAVLVPLVGYATFSPALTGHALLAALPSAAAMLVMMLCVEYPDVEADARVGKRNLVVRAGRGPARALVYLAVGGVYVATALAIVLGATPALGLFAGLTLPVASSLVLRLAQGRYGEPAADGDVAARGVALFVATQVGSALAYTI